jgi:parvulin-like peptidyl-prolyl isomerase
LAKKKKAEKPPREYTRRQLSQFKRQKRRQRITLIGGIFVIAVVVLIVLLGWYIGEYRPMHQTVIRVYDTEFDMDYYIDMLKIGGQGQSADYLQSIADSVTREIEQNELIKRAAAQLNITVSDDEVREHLKSLNTSINDASMDLGRNQMLRDRLYDEYFEAMVPVSDRQVHIMAMLLESESQAAEIRNRLQNSENFTTLAEEFSLNDYTKNNKGDVGWHPEGVLAALLGSSVPGEYAFSSEVGVLSQPRYDEGKTKDFGYWLIRVQEKEYEEEAQVQAILLGSEEEAQDVKARLEAGEDVATLAEELSQFEESQKQGGSLGLVSEGEMSAAFDEYVFNPEVEIGVWSEPIRDETVTTRGCYWLIKVLDRADDRPLETDDRDYLLSVEYNNWVSKLWIELSQDDIDDSYLDYEKKAWAIERAAGG